jgi:hypothetical protein
MGHRTALKEAIEYNIFTEYKALGEYIPFHSNQKIHEYELGRYKILEYIINCLHHDPDNGDWYDDNNVKLIRDAGELLYKYDGMNGMHDALVWSFIPKRYQREIDMIWNGIGEWNS